MNGAKKNNQTNHVEFSKSLCLNAFSKSFNDRSSAKQVIEKVHVYPICTSIFKYPEYLQVCAKNVYDEKCWGQNPPTCLATMQEVNCMLGRRLRCSGLVACQHCRTVPGSEPWKHSTCRGTLVGHDKYDVAVFYISLQPTLHPLLLSQQRSWVYTPARKLSVRNTHVQPFSLSLSVRKVFSWWQKGTPLRCDSSSLS